MTRIEFVPKEAILERRANGDPFQLVEVLSNEKYAEGHLPGAVSIPEKEIGSRADLELDKGGEVIVYCASYSCEASTRAARKLADLGFERVLDYKGGKADWAGGGLPLERGEAPAQASR